MSKTVNLKIDGVNVEVPEGYTILDAAYKAGIKIPTLCYMKDLNAIGACRLCLVDVEGERSYLAACVTAVSEGMVVNTNTPALRKSRQKTLELILSNHRTDCLSCARNTNCELQTLCYEHNVDMDRFGRSDMEPDIDDSAVHLIRDNSKCILCRRCVAACDLNQHVAVIGPNKRGYETHIGSAFGDPLDATSCIHCGQCIVVCPVGALTEKDETEQVWAALADPSKYVIVAPAPSVRVQLGECFGMPIGTNVQGKMAAALRRMGFDSIFDVDTAADLTIMEEGTELLERINSGGVLPLITSCSPGWIKFCEYYFPEFIPNISSCKSPQQMMGSVSKTYFAEKQGIDPKDIFVVSIMPCTAKKFEKTRANQSASGYPDIDAALTTRELAKMIKQANIIFDKLPDEEFDPVFGMASGAAHIFGATGGVTEAALRTLSEILTGEAPNIDFVEVRGTKGIKEAEYELAGIKVRIAVTSGLENAHQLLTMIKNGEKDYHFIEVMACPGGCVNGGGQPIQPSFITNNLNVRHTRAMGLYNQDAGMELRKSIDNPVMNELYDTYFGKPGSEKAHKILHTSYVKREIN